MVTTHSIRYRILKEDKPQLDAVAIPGYNPFDPIQDTERSKSAGPYTTGVPRYNPFDPIQDTERWVVAVHVAGVPSLQPIRSDTGY